MNLTSQANSVTNSHSNQLVIEGFEMGAFDKLKIIRSVQPSEMFPESWKVVDASGKVLREFHNEKDAKDYQKYLNNLKIHEIDMLLMSLFRDLDKARKEIEFLKKKKS